MSGRRIEPIPAWLQHPDEQRRLAAFRRMVAGEMLAGMHMRCSADEIAANAGLIAALRDMAEVDHG